MQRPGEIFGEWSFSALGIVVQALKLLVDGKVFRGGRG